MADKRTPEGLAKRRERDRLRAPEKNRKYHAANSEKIAAQKAARKAADPERVAAIAKAWQERTVERRRATAKAYAEQRPDKIREASAKFGKSEKGIAYRKKWALENADRIAKKAAEWSVRRSDLKRAAKARRRASSLQATPAWADAAAINEIFAEAKRLTDEILTKHEVDHIIPLQGKLVCGLHCENNLQILTRSQNRRKNNRMNTGIGLV